MLDEQLQDILRNFFVECPESKELLTDVTQQAAKTR
jgi:hypothetical protein